MWWRRRVPPPGPMSLLWKQFIAIAGTSPAHWSIGLKMLHFTNIFFKNILFQEYYGINEHVLFLFKIVFHEYIFQERLNFKKMDSKPMPDKLTETVEQKRREVT